MFSHVALIHGLSSLMNLPGDNKSYIVYVSSVQSVIALPERSGYSASKAAVSGLCDSLRAEVRNEKLFFYEDMEHEELFFYVDLC